MRKFILLLFFIVPFFVKSQHTVKHLDIIWATYINTIQFNKKWALVSDAQVRTVDWANKWLLYGVRSGVNYTVNTHLTLEGGFLLFRTAQYVDKNYFFKNEWRPWQGVTYNIKFNQTNFFQRLRTEERFLQETFNNKKIDSYQYLFRVRYRFEGQFSLEKNLKLLAGNEVFVNPGHLNDSLFFDQNRTAVGLSERLGAHSTLQAQYIKIFQWRSSSRILENQNVIRVNFIQQFNLKRKTLNKV